jgi:hypothetical protein
LGFGVSQNQVEQKTLGIVRNWSLREPLELQGWFGFGATRYG